MSRLRVLVLASKIPGIHEATPLYPAVNPDPFKIKDKELPAPPASPRHPWLTIFSQNVIPPLLWATFPPPGTCFKTITQLACWDNLLRTQSALLNLAQYPWIESYVQNVGECNHIHSLIQRVVDEFTGDNIKTIDTLSEVLLLAPSLDLEHYRKLFNCVIAEFESARVLDPALLQGLVQLVESASSDYLESDDIVRILSVLCTHRKETRQAPTKQLFNLTWSLSRLLDVMVEGKVKDVGRVVDQEPLSALFSQLKGSKDPHLRSQITYAFQGLLHIPNDENRRQFMLRNSDNITMGLLGVASVCKLDPGQLKKGADYLYEAAGEAQEVATEATDGARPLLESSQGIWASVKGGIFSGGRQLWYTSLREAQEHIRNGRLQDFKNLVFETPCRDHVDFQWGICQLIGEIAIDPLWETSVRQQALVFLAELYRDERIWAPSEGIYRWILEILRMIVSLGETPISYHAMFLLRGLEIAGDATKQEIYRDTLADSLSSHPIQVRLPIPTSSTMLLHVLAVPAVEYTLFRLKEHRLKKPNRALYIQLQAKPSLYDPDDTLFPLMEKVLTFFTGPSRVFLLLGDSGGGKSTFSLQLERTLWKIYKQGDPIPLYIDLPSMDNPQKDMIDKQLRQHQFTEAQIVELKQNRRFIVICDGYDESQSIINIYSTNLFNKPGQWNVKMVVTCRTQYHGTDYRDSFMPQGDTPYDRPNPDLFQEAVIAPFTKEQIESYVNMYVPQGTPTWGTWDYMDKLATIPHLLDLVKNPYLLHLTLETLPNVPEAKYGPSAIDTTRVRLYDTIVQSWLEVDKRRLHSSALREVDNEALGHFFEDSFVAQAVDCLKRLSIAILKKKEGNTVFQNTHSQDKSSWNAEFSGTDAENKLLRHVSLLARAGNRFKFIHPLMLEYFFSRVVYNPTEYGEEVDPQVCASLFLSNNNNPLFQKIFLESPVIDFLCGRAKIDSIFEQLLHAVIERSKTDNSVATGAANAIMILDRASVSSNGADLRCAKIPNADLSGGQLDSAQFQGADLRGVNLSKCQLRQADMSGANMEEAWNPV